MMDYTLRDFQPEDLMAITPDDETGRRAFACIGPISREDLGRLYSRGPARTLEVHGRVVACAGIVVWNPNLEQRTGEAWALVDHAAAQACPLLVSRAVRKGLEEFQREYNIVRVNALAEAGNRRNVRWLEALGFEREALCRKWIDGVDFYLYARVLQ